ncbi:MAG: CBS domain-containing protein [Cyanobacteria bacterium REEB459]|nr:CBS domain-containing protein [Cyanobacteria bacterium REEB459]
MDLILCHTTADFDTLGAAVGLARLQPGSRIVLTGGCHPTVQRFVALHRHEYPLIERRAVDPRHIRSLTLVDAQQPDRFGPAAQWITQPNPPPLRVYDHHPSPPGNQPTAGVIEPVGAATTLVVEAMQRQGVRPTLAEATVMALGIHVDTGSLIFEQTTLRDARALTWLMEQGANLQVIAEFVEPGLSPPLQDLLTTAMARLKLETVQGYSLAWVVLAVDHYIAGLSGLAERLISLADVDLLLLGVHYPGKETGPVPCHKLLLVGRAQGRVSARLQRPGVDWGAIFAPLGGGGHAAAAAVTLTTDNPAGVVDQVLAQARSQLPHPPTAQDLMSSPVRTIRPDTTMAEAQRVLLRYGHSGLSVVDGAGNLVGVVSRRDLDLAVHHGFTHAPVKGYMATNLKTITPQTPLSDIEALMVTYDIGRLPVIHQGTLVGIVTRTDLLRHLHQNLIANGWSRGTLPPTQEPLTPALQSAMATQLGPELQSVLGQMATIAQARGWHLYLVGGVVRDLLLPPGERQGDWTDLDLVVDSCRQPVQVGAAAELAEQFRCHYPQVDVQVHGQFQTASLVWSRHLDHPLAGLMIDIATARTEFYPYPAANPEVEASSIQQDLYRRDFTINAMALRLTSPGEGELLDYFGGLTDLRQRQIRVLHPNSFIEDPTRIFRAVKFAVRLGFQLDSQTMACIRCAVDSGIYSQLQRQAKPLPALQVRLKNELRFILQAPYWEPALVLLDQLQALRCLHAELVLTPSLWHQLRRLSRWLQRFPWGQTCSAWEMRLETLIAAVPAPARRSIAVGLQLTDEAIDRLDQLQDLETTWGDQITRSLAPSQLYRLFQPVSLPLLLLVSNRHPRSLGPPIWRYLTQWLDLPPLVNGDLLKSLGYSPGPAFRLMLEAVLAAQLDGVIHSQDQALEFLAHHYPRQSIPLYGED